MRKIATRISFVILLVLFCASLSHALPLITNASFSSTGYLILGGSTSPPDTFHLDLFDPTLGTLDSVSIQITGTTTFVGPTYQYYVQTYPTPIPYSYPITTNIYHNFMGLWAGEFFSLENLAPYTITLPATGTGAPISYTHFFNYTFTFTDATDLVSGGFIGPPATQIIGTRDDFIKDPVFSLEQMQFYATGDVISQFPQYFTLTTGGSIIVQYNYTPFTPDPVPEPSTFLLLGSSLAGLAWYRRRNKE